MPSQVRAAALTNFFEVIRARGVNPLPLLREVDLSLALLSDPDQRIPTESVVRLLELAAEATHDEQLGLRMAQTRQLADFGMVSLLISHQPTLRDALQTLMDYRHLVNDSLALKIEDVGQRVILREEVISGFPARQASELAMGVLMRLCSGVLGPAWRPAYVCFSHAKPQDTQWHERFFRCPVHFDSEYNGLVCHADDLAAPNPAAAPAMAHYAQRLVDNMASLPEPSTVQEVRKVIYLMLSSGQANAAYVAQAMGLSVRTLQRRLDAAGVDFSQLVHEVRMDLAQRHLANPRHSMVAISQMLGYSAPSAFTRWFCVQFGRSPTRWREQALALKPDDGATD